MDSLFDLTRIIATVAGVGAILFGLYRGLCWRFPRVGRFRTGLIIGLGVLILVAISTSRLKTSDAECLAHENTVLLRGERIINFRQAKVERQVRTSDFPQYAKVLASCKFLVPNCKLDRADEAGVTTAEICDLANTGAPLN